MTDISIPALIKQRDVLQAQIDFFNRITQLQKDYDQLNATSKSVGLSCSCEAGIFKVKSI